MLIYAGKLTKINIFTQFQSALLHCALKAADKNVKFKLFRRPEKTQITGKCNNKGKPSGRRVFKLFAVYVLVAAPLFMSLRRQKGP